MGGWRQRSGRTWLGRAPHGSTARPLPVINCGRVTAASVAGPHITRTFSAAATAPPLEGVDLSIRSMRPSATLAINEASAKLVAAGETVYKFGLGQSPFPVPQPMVDALRSHAAEKDYIAVAGLPLLREAVAGWCNRVVGGREHTADDMYGALDDTCRRPFPPHQRTRGSCRLAVSRLLLAWPCLHASYV